MKIRDYSRIVVEGMDGAGKTTLVHQILTYLGDQAFPVPGYNRVEGTKPPMQVWWMNQLNYNPPGKVVVHDRFFYPELVYGPVLRGKLEADPSTINYVTEFLRHHALVIYCRPPVEVIAEGVKVEKQMKGVREHFNELLFAYDQVMLHEADMMNGRLVAYDWTKDEALAQLVKTLAGYIYQ